MDSEKDIKKAVKRLVVDNEWDKARALYHSCIANTKVKIV
jgi:hypothetical protein